MCYTYTQAKEAEFHPGRKETREVFLKRLRQTALALPRSVVSKAVHSMKRRCEDILAAKGNLIRE